MPFKSEKQRRWMHANEPEMAKRWEKDSKKECAPKMTDVFESVINQKMPSTADTANTLRNQAKGLDAGKLVPGTQIATALKNTAAEMQKDPQKKYKVFNGQVAMEPEQGLNAVGGKPMQNTQQDKNQQNQNNMLNPFSGKA